MSYILIYQKNKKWINLSLIEQLSKEQIKNLNTSKNHELINV